MLGMIMAALGLLPALAPPALGVPMQVIDNHVVVSSIRLSPRRPGARVGGHVRLVGVGGNVQSGGIATVARVHIGAAAFADQRFVVTAARRSTFAAAEGPAVDGLIGNAIIGSGVTVFDYAHGTLSFDAAQEAVGRAVLAVWPQTPAERAGIAAGDRILAADGQTFEPKTLPALRALLEGPAGTCVELLISSTGAAARTVELQLADYL